MLSLQLLIPILLCGASLFWLLQILHVLRTDRRYFESHTHKLVWFLVVLLSYIVGAIWFFVWKRRAIAARREAARQEAVDALAAACRRLRPEAHDGPNEGGAAEAPPGF